MRSYDGYRALIVLATILVHMSGTLSVRVGNKTKRQSGESSSSAPILSLFLFSVFLFSFSVSVTLYVCVFLVVRENDPYHLRQVRMSRVAPPSSSPATCFFLLRPLLALFLMRRINVGFIIRVPCACDPFFTLYFFSLIYILHLITTCIFYFYFYTFYFPLLSLFHSLVFSVDF